MRLSHVKVTASFREKRWVKEFLAPRILVALLMWVLFLIPFALIWVAYRMLR